MLPPFDSTSQQPQSFVGGLSYHAPATPPTQTEDQRIRYVSRLAPRLTVQADGEVRLNAEAARLLPPGDGTIDLRPPVAGKDWHLDCRSGGHYRRLAVGTSGGIRFKAAARTSAILGVCAEVQHFSLEPCGNGLFRLYTESVNN